jgi:H+/Cl- antiporter ClcA
VSVGAGFSSVFGTPLAGAVFALEFFLVGKITYQRLFPVFITAILADLVTRAWQAPHTHYQIYFVPELTFLNVFYAMIAGVIFGFCAKFFSYSMHFLSNIFRKYIKNALLRPFLGGSLVLLMIYFLGGNTNYIGLGIEEIVNAFKYPLLWYVFALKIVFTVITLSSGFKGGEVTPLFFIGATLGNAVAYIVPLPLSLLAGMGFVAVFAGATNTPLACLLMGIELFGGSPSVYIAVACVLSYVISGRSSIYKKQKIENTKIS